MTPAHDTRVDCQHFGEAIGRRIHSRGNAITVYRCCVFTETTLNQCFGCNRRIPVSQPIDTVPDKTLLRPQPKRLPLKQATFDFTAKPTTPVDVGLTARRVIKKHIGTLLGPGGTCNLSNLFAGNSAFLLLPGPSAGKLNLSLLDRRGVLSMGVNNSPALHRVNLWTHVDPASKFHHAIWEDAAVMKFTPEKRMLHGSTRRKVGSKFIDAGIAAGRHANVFGYPRNADFNPDIWLREASVNWGNSKKSANRNKHPHVLNVMLAAIKILYYLGVDRIFLLGCDWHMDDRQCYAFAEERHPGKATANNASYGKVASMLDLLQPRFMAENFTIFNCNPQSYLRLYPYFKYEDAIDLVSARMLEPLDTEGWYGK